jgi:hypothetical protein
MPRARPDRPVVLRSWRHTTTPRLPKAELWVLHSAAVHRGRIIGGRIPPDADRPSADWTVRRSA